MNCLAKEDVLSSMEEEHQLSITSSMFLSYDSITIQKEKSQNEADKQSEQSLAIENDQHLNNSLASLPSFSSIGSGIHSLDQLEKFGDWSGSELESESVPQKSDWGDKLIKIFIAKRRALLIDQDEEDIVSYEESDSRISALLLMTAGMFYAISLILLIMNYIKAQSPELTVLVYEPKVKVTFLEPKIAIMDKSSGLLSSMTLHNETLIKPDWQIKLPKSELRDFLPYYDNGAMNVIYGSYAHDMTYIDVGSQGTCHRVVPKSRFGYSWKPEVSMPFQYSDMDTVRLGNSIILFVFLSLFLCEKSF